MFQDAGFLKALKDRERERETGVSGRQHRVRKERDSYSYHRQRQ